jgi:hypothetical protein
MRLVTSIDMPITGSAALLVNILFQAARCLSHHSCRKEGLTHTSGPATDVRLTFTPSLLPVMF